MLLGGLGCEPADKNLLSIHSFIYSLSVTAYPFAGLWGVGGRSQSQLTLGEGGVHPGQVASSLETNNHSYFAFCLCIWTVGGSRHRRSPHRRGENIPTERSYPSRVLNLRPFDVR